MLIVFEWVYVRYSFRGKYICIIIVECSIRKPNSQLTQIREIKYANKKLWSNFSSISFEDVPDFPYVGFVLYVYTFSLPFVFAPPHPSRSACLLYFLWCYFEWLFHINMCTVNTAIYFRYVYMCMNSRIRTWVNSVGWMYDSQFHNFTRTYHIYFFLSIICLNRWK